MQFDLGHINKVIVIHIELTGEEPLFHFMGLKKAKEEIKFLKNGERIHSMDDLLKQTGVNDPFLLHFTGKGILNRKTVFQENYRHSILLNANMDDFYFSDYVSEKMAFSSVIRKDTVSEYLNIFKEKSGQVISVSSGPFHSAVLGSVLGFENQKEEPIKKLKIGEFVLHIENAKLVDFKKVDQEDDLQQRSIVLGEERISNQLIPCATAGAAFFNPTDAVVLPEDEEVFMFNHEEAKQKNIFTRFGMGMMLFFLVLLLANYLYLGHLNQEVIDNSFYLSEYDEQLNQIADLEEERTRKERLLQSSGLLNKNFLSYYLMEMGNSVPQAIIFDKLVIRPIEGEMKRRQKIAFQEHLIQLEGRAETSIALSKWIEDLEDREWLTKVDIVSYDYIKNEGVFELEIMMH